MLRDYLRRKYAERNIDVSWPTASIPLDFSSEIPQRLFPDASIVFATMSVRRTRTNAQASGATGIVYARVTEGHWTWR